MSKKATIRRHLPSLRMIALGTASTMALCTSVGAFAQEAAPSDDAQEVADDDNTIVVTADRREQSLQDYAGTAAVFSGEELRSRGIQDITDFNDEVPGLTVANNGGNVEIWIRGVGSSNNTELGDPAAAFHYDGVYVPRPSGIGSAFFDIERVEVNVGPQGTLRGRNATAGSVNAIAWKPGIGVWDANVEVGYGNYDHKEFRGMINVPLGDNLAFRLAGMYLGHDSYYNNVGPIQTVDVAESADNKAFRAQLLWEPTDRLSVLVAGDYIHEEGTGYTGTNYAQPLGVALERGQTIDDLNLNDPRDVIANAFTPDEDIKHWGIRTTITYEGDNVSVEYTGSYRDLLRNYDANTPLTPAYDGVLDDLRTTDNVFTPDPNDVIVSDDVLNEALDNFSRFQFITDSESHYHELRLFNNDGPFIWSLGGMYFKEDQYSFLGSAADRNPYFQGAEFNTQTQSETWSIYGDATFEVSDRFRITGGLRYTDDKKAREGIAARYALALGGGSFECCLGVRVGTEGFAFAGRDRTIFNPDTDGDGNVSDQEVFTFWQNGIRSFGVRDNLDEILAFGPKAGAFDSVPGSPECLDTNQFDTLFCTGFRPNTEFSYAVPYQGQIFRQTGSTQDDFVDWRLRAEYDVTDDNLLYALVATGHKSGGFNDNIGDAGVAPTYDTEKVTLYELGSKNEFFIGEVRARLNASAFYNDYSNQVFTSILSVQQIIDFQNQLGNNIPVPPNTSTGLVVSYSFNAADSEIYGVNIEGGLELPANINFDFNALWLEAKIKNAQDIQDFRFQADVDAVNAVFRPINGRRLPRTPRWQLNAALSQQIEAKNGSFDWVISAGYRSSQFHTIFNSLEFDAAGNATSVTAGRLLDRIDGYFTFDLGAGYSHGDDGKLRFEVYANNVTNKQEEAAIIITQFDNTRFFTRPRTFGARMRVRF